jgi:hypothetical protein
MGADAAFPGYRHSGLHPGDLVPFPFEHKGLSISRRRFLRTSTLTAAAVPALSSWSLATASPEAAKEHRASDGAAFHPFQVYRKTHIFQISRVEPPAWLSCLCGLYSETERAKYLFAAKQGALHLRGIATLHGNAALIPYRFPDLPDLYYLGFCHGPAGTVHTFFEW